MESGSRFDMLGVSFVLAFDHGLLFELEAELSENSVEGFHYNSDVVISILFQKSYHGLG